MKPQVIVEGKNMQGKREISTNRMLYYRESILNGLYKDLAAEGQPEQVKEYIRFLIFQFESGL